MNTLKKLLILTLLLFFPLSFVYSAMTLSDVKIKIQGQHQSRQQIDKLFPYKKGQTISKEELEQRVVELRSTGLFKSITYNLKNRGFVVSILFLKMDNFP